MTATSANGSQILFRLEGFRVAQEGNSLPAVALSPETETISQERAVEVRWELIRVQIGSFSLPGIRCLIVLSLSSRLEQQSEGCGESRVSQISHKRTNCRPGIER